MVMVTKWDRVSCSCCSLARPRGGPVVFANMFAVVFAVVFAAGVAFSAKEEGGMTATLGLPEYDDCSRNG